MIRILTIIGTRPEAIKMAPIALELAKYPKRILSRICVTAQHRDMLDQALSQFGVEPDYDLDIMQPGQTPTHAAYGILQRLEPVLTQERPHWVLAQGDTTTAMAAALAAYYQRIPTAHVEAGLRTRDPWEPFPEEINRRLCDAIAKLHFAPTEGAKRNLLREGISESSIHVTGNPVIDALFLTLKKPHNLEYVLPQIPWEKKIILMTAHRRESFGEPLRNICRAAAEIVRLHPETHILYPVHPNPNVQEAAREYLQSHPGVTLTPPLDYHTLVHVMSRSYFVLTDSGGVQEEAPSLGKPVLVLRNKTERPEAVEAGTAKLAGASQDTIVAEACRLLEEEAEYQRMARAINPYGDGKTSDRIVKILLESASS